jgi:SAM-dependent methyltransferase
MSSKLKNLLRMAAGPVRERGLVETVRSVRSCLHDRARERADPFDAAFGTDTEQRVTLADLEATGGDVPALWRYWPTPRATFGRIMEAVSVPFSQTTFVDLGSGKGRVLLMAAEYSFHAIVGVELSPSLHAIARANLSCWRSPTQRCRRVELLCMDARDWQPPSGELLVYLFQPFPAETLRAVIDHLAGAAGVVHLAYLNPLHHALVVGSGAFARVHHEPAAQKGEFDWAIYRSTM